MSELLSTVDFGREGLEELGKLLWSAAAAGEEIACLLPDSVREVNMTALAFGQGEPPTLAEGLAIVTGHWHAVGDLAPTTQARLAEVLAHAATRAERLGVSHWDDNFDKAVCTRFVRSMTRSGDAPSVSTQHLRRSGLRAGFATLRSVGLFKGDPTIDLALPPRSQLAARAASDDEIALLRLHSVASRQSRQPTALALAETTATSSELPVVSVLELDDPETPQSVALPGSKKVRPRTGALSAWGSKVITSNVRMRRNEGVPDDFPLAYFGGQREPSASPQASACAALNAIFRRAGLDREPDLSPRSITFWAGRQVFDATTAEKLEAAARAMGIASLDRAARRIDYSWDAQ